MEELTQEQLSELKTEYLDKGILFKEYAEEKGLEWNQDARRKLVRQVQVQYGMPVIQQARKKFKERMKFKRSEFYIKALIRDNTFKTIEECDEAIASLNEAITLVTDHKNQL